MPELSHFYWIHQLSRMLNTHNDHFGKNTKPHAKEDPNNGRWLLVDKNGTYEVKARYNQSIGKAEFIDYIEVE